MLENLARQVRGLDQEIEELCGRAERERAAGLPAACNDMLDRRERLRTRALALPISSLGDASAVLGIIASGLEQPESAALERVTTLLAGSEIYQDVKLTA